MNKEMEKALQSVFDELLEMPEDQLLHELENAPQNELAEAMAYASTCCFDKENYSGVSTEYSVISAADENVYYGTEDFQWLLAA